MLEHIQLPSHLPVRPKILIYSDKEREEGGEAEFPWTLLRQTDGRFSVQMLHEGTTFGSCRPFVLFCCVIQYDIHTTDRTDFTHRCLSLIFYGYFTLISLNWNECVAQFVTVWMSIVTTFNPQHTKSTQVIRRQCYDPVGVGENVFLELTAALVNAVTVNVIKT